ncbi:hypothetical protein AFK68_01950, partial [Hydrocoleum sp. CS-953]
YSPTPLLPYSLNYKCSTGHGITGFKPQQRILKASSNAGDPILDLFAGTFTKSFVRKNCRGLETKPLRQNVTIYLGWLYL